MLHHLVANHITRQLTALNGVKGGTGQEKEIGKKKNSTDHFLKNSNGEHVKRTTYLHIPHLHNIINPNSNNDFE